MDKDRVRQLIAGRIAAELKDHDVVNLGIGLPTLVADYLKPGITIYFHSENGIIGFGPKPVSGQEDPGLINAGGGFITSRPFSSCFDSAYSFGIIRGKHLDVAVLGGLQVDQEGNLANWMIPGKMIPGMGGAMDLVTGAKRVIVGMEHADKSGKPKILKQCSLPLTGTHCVDTIVTEMGFFKIENQRVVLYEYCPEFSVDDIKAVTEAELIIHPDLKPMSA
ncbi:MAG: CoA transferase subunit B [Candidatus Delongbacteria bacterium]|nr:CoA transferase subunit B [Candidatus Delongbacteria bacterium]